MNSDPLNDLLGAYSKQATPPPPDRLTSGVWQEIELRRTQTFWRRVLPSLDWRELFREPRLAFPALALALFIGMLPAFALRSYAQADIVRESLHFEVFSPNRSSTSPWIAPHRATKLP